MVDLKEVFQRAAFLLLAGLICGCSSAYHGYSSCSVNCRYCPPPTLPHAEYSECECHSTVAMKYLQSDKASAGNSK